MTTTRRSRFLIPACLGGAIGILPAIGYFWFDLLRGEVQSPFLLRILFLPAAPSEFILRSLGFNIYFVEAHGPTRETYLMWVLNSAACLSFWLLVALTASEVWRLLRRSST